MDNESKGWSEHAGILGALLTALSGVILAVARALRIRSVTKRAEAKDYTDLMERNIDAQTKNAKAMATVLEAAEFMLADLQSRYDALQEQHAKLQAAYDELLVKIDSLSAELTEARAEISQLRSQLRVDKNLQKST